MIILKEKAKGRNGAVRLREPIQGRKDDEEVDRNSPSGIMNPNALRFEMTKFGNPTLNWGNYRFIKKLTRRDKTWWECTSRKSCGCRCLAVTVNGRLTKLNGWHNHKS